MIYVFFANGFEEVEALAPVDILRRGGVDLGVVLPVVTRPGQFDSVNAFAAQLCEREGLISFGGIHPDDETPEEHIGKICELGLRGIKIHPDYQGVFIDDERYIRIARETLRQCVRIRKDRSEYS